MKMILLIAIAFGLNNCFSIESFLSDKTVNFDVAFVLKKDETATLKDADWHLKMLGNGQAQQDASGDVVFCEFEIKSKNKTDRHTLNAGDTSQFEDFNVKLGSVNTTADSKLKDPWSATSCEFVVTKK